MSVHVGPAGSTFFGTEHAGRHALKINCDNYPQTTNSYIIPPLFISKYPEGLDPATSKPQPRVAPPISSNERKNFDGICSGQGGEQIEYKVFNLFTKLIAKQQPHPILILRDFEFNTKGKFNLKQATFMSEYPHIPKISMRGEADYIVLLKNLGCVAVEVKRTLSVRSLQKAQYQLDHSELFLNQVMQAVTQLNSQCLPIAKLLIYEKIDPQGPLPSNLSTVYNYFICSGNSIVGLEQKWNDIIQKLQTNTPPNPLMPVEFIRLLRLLTGLWCLKSMNRQPYFDVNDASLPHSTKQVDVSVDHAHLSSGFKKRDITNDPPVTNVMYNQQETVFRKGNEINLIYLTPNQKNIYDNIQRGIIRGPAGTGKTLLILFKIIDLIQSPNNNKKILLLAPYPHTIRCKNILQANNVLVVNSEEKSRGQPHDVVLMDIKEVFEEYSNFTILSNFSSYHIFMDDFQNVNNVFKVSNVAQTVNFGRYDVDGILTTLNRAYEISSHNMSYFWCMMDEVQDFRGLKDNQFYLTLYSNAGDDTGRATIPVYCLDNILRNTEEIAHVVLEQRDTNKKIYFSTIPQIAARPSHKITSALPTFHKLTNFTNNDDRNDFMFARVEDELRQLLRVKNPTMCPSDIAILYDVHSPNISDVVKRVKELLARTFHIISMSINRQLNTQSSTIVMDDVRNATSGEWPVVIYLYTSLSSYRRLYAAFSRARTRLVVIGLVVIGRDFSLSGMKEVKWKKENNNFVQC